MAFTDDELERFMQVVRNPRHKLCFSLQYLFGLRLGEAVQVRHSDIDFEHKTLKVLNIKLKEYDSVDMSEKAYDVLQKATSRNKGALFARGIPPRDWLFPSPSDPSKHVTAGTMRKYFNIYRRYAGLDKQICAVIPTYGDQCARRTDHRNIYRLKAHSLRAYFITKVYEASGNDIVVTQRAARHRRLESTMAYIMRDKKLVEAAIKKAFDGKEISKEDSEIMKEFAEFMAWKKKNGRN